MIKTFLVGLALLFIGLKLGHIIAWSWWFVLLPVSVPLCLTLFVALVESIDEALHPDPFKEFFKK